MRRLSTVIVFSDSVGANPCDGSNCSHICLLSSLAEDGFVCACPDGGTLNDDGQTCKIIKWTLLMTGS